MTFSINERKPDGSIVATYKEGETQDTAVWKPTQSRKERYCLLSGRPILPGDKVYSPDTDGDYKDLRVLIEEADRATIGLSYQREDRDQGPTPEP